MTTLSRVDVNNFVNNFVSSEVDSYLLIDNLPLPKVTATQVFPILIPWTTAVQHQKTIELPSFNEFSNSGSLVMAYFLLTHHSLTYSDSFLFLKLPYCN